MVDHKEDKIWISELVIVKTSVSPEFLTLNLAWGLLKPTLEHCCLYLYGFFHKMNMTVMSIGVV